jgi:hypothetical protein
MLHYARGLAASPPVLYKLIVGRRAASPFLFLATQEPSLREASATPIETNKRLNWRAAPRAGSVGVHDLAKPATLVDVGGSCFFKTSDTNAVTFNRLGRVCFIVVMRAARRAHCHIVAAIGLLD